jgi:hypothetical protein
MRRVVNKMANICKQAEVHSQTQLLICLFILLGVLGGLVEKQAQQIHRRWSKKEGEGKK